MKKILATLLVTVPMVAFSQSENSPSGNTPNENASEQGQTASQLKGDNGKHLGQQKQKDGQIDSSKAQGVVNNRQERQEKRIEEGVKNGTVSPQELDKLNKQQGRIQKAEDKAMADGKMSKQEFKKIQKMQNHASRDIRREKHDNNNHRGGGKRR